MKKREGPTRVHVPAHYERSCCRCVFLSVQLILLGLDERESDSDYYCTQPDIIAKRAEASGAEFAQPRAYIGQTDRTPRWCPYQPARSMRQ